MSPATVAEGYQVWRAERAPEDGPTIIALHGTGGDAASFGGLVERLAPRAAIVAPQGDVSEMGAPRFFRRRAEGVYDMDDLERAVDKFDRFLDADGAGATVGIGFSNGANLLAAHAFARPGRLRSLVLLRPLIPYEPPAGDLAGVRVLIAAGRTDSIAPVPASEALAGAFAARGAEVDLRWTNAGHGLTQEEVPTIVAALS